MKSLRYIFDKQAPYFEEGGKLQKLFPLYEMVDTFIFSPGDTTNTCSHVRDGIDLKRVMITVFVATIPCIFMAMYNTGLQANNAIATMGIQPEGWRYIIMDMLGIGLNAGSALENVVHGAMYFVPVFLVTNLAGGFWEALFATVRKHEINEGFLVTGILFPLILPATIPLWQVAVGISFGVIIGKEVFGGTGKNFLNPALTARAFLFFAYPAQISGDAVWTAADGFTGATSLAKMAESGITNLGMSWNQALMGNLQGSMGETSVIAVLLGAAILIISGIGSWRIMVSVVLGAGLTALIFNSIGSSTNPLFSVPPLWHFVVGGFAFGTVFMATDPVSAAITPMGKWVYGALIGVMVILIRVVNPAFPEGMMLAILFGNVFAPLIDYFVVKANVNRRLARG